MIKLLLLAVTVGAVARVRALPFLALAVATAFFGVAAGLSLGMIGKSFGNGFGDAIAGAGIAVLGAAMISALAGGAAVPSARKGLWLAPCVGLIGGIGAAPAMALAFMAPLRGALGGGRRGTLSLGLALSAGHGLLLPSPVLVAAVAILGADWRLVTLAGVPCAVLAAAVGAAVARRGASGVPGDAPRPGLALICACWAPVALLMVQSLGYIPSEPLGGGGAREMLLGVGRPLVLLLAGVGIMAVAAWRNARGDWAGRAVREAAALTLAVGAAGGLQAVIGAARAGEALAEPVSAWHLGVLAPFAAAFLMKVLQGSSLTAAITAAGMVLPLLPDLGLAGGGGRAAAALAVGAGAMAGAQINDPFFWVLADGAGLSVSRGLVFITLATVVQGVAIVPVLLILAR